ncbi:MAG: hypothetical protein IJ264_05375, partial [Clostridia bacterium]|nr:hypothetical protein [Clostridia bacterium]
MSVTKKIIIAVVVVAVLVFVEIKFNLVRNIIFQFSSDAYINYVSGLEYEQDLIDDPICAMDMQ